MQEVVSHMGSCKGRSHLNLKLAKDSYWWSTCCTYAVLGKTCEQVVDLDIGKIGHANASSESIDCTHHIKNIS
jgi:hypothetical protein